MGEEVEIKQEQTQKPPTQIENNPSVTESKPNYWKIITIGLLLLLIILAGVITFIFRSQNTSTQTAQKTDNLSQKTEITNNKIELVYLKDEGLWVLDSSGNSKQITSSGQFVYRYNSSADNSLIAYVLGEKVTNENNSASIIPNSVYIYLSGKDETKKIYALVPKRIPDSLYSLIIKDVGVSKDGTKVAITTSDSLLLYDVFSDNLQEIFSYAVKFSTETVVFRSYNHPIFSPDNSKIVFMKGYYEEGTYGFVDLSTKNVQDLPYAGYVSGKRVIGWFDNSSLIVDEYENDPPSNMTSKITVAELSNSSKLTFLTDLEGFASTVILANNKIYATKELENIIGFDLKTKSKKNLYTKKEEAYKKDAMLKSYFIQNLKTSPDGKKLYISSQVVLSDNPSKMPKYSLLIRVLDLEKSGEPQDLIQNASF